MAQQQSQEPTAPQNDPVWWWRSATGRQDAVTSSETELLSAAVLCAALSATRASPCASDALANARAARELELHVRKSPLPHSLQLPVLEFTTDFVLVESQGAVICAMRATSPGDIVQAVVGSAVPLSQPYVYRFGGTRVHAPFWKRAQRLNLAKLYAQAQQVNKVLLLCGHSIGGSIAKLAFCELVYTRLPEHMREVLGQLDAEQAKGGGKDHDKHPHKHKKRKNQPGQWMVKVGNNDREAAVESLPVAMMVGFGAPYAGNDILTTFLEPLGMQDRVVTFVNEFDCIPGILNVAHSAAMLAKTTERLVTIAKATKALLNLLPAPMQRHIIDMTKTAGSSAVPSATSAYLSMSIAMLQKSFDKLREFNVVKTIDYRYAPCGSYIFMAKENAEFSIFSDPAQIRKALGEDGDEATAGLTGNSILQHMMSAYVDSIARRSRSIHINATMNHYERLGVARNASDREIRRSYRNLALKWHPDRVVHGSLTDQQKEAAEDIFKLLAESYEVLSNKESRSAYDTYLNRLPSRREEFLHYGTVDGITLDEAIATFKDAVDNITSTLHRVTDRFSSSSSTTVGHPLQHNAGKTPATASAPGGHASSSGGVHVSSTNLSMASDNASNTIPSSASTQHASPSAPVASSGAVSTSSAVPASSSGVSASTSEVLGKTGELATSNNAEMSTQLINTRSSSDSVSSRASSTSTSLKTVSVVGGAVAVAASVAIIVSAWSQFSEASRKKRQAAAVRDMPGDCLVLLLEDRKTVQQRRSRTPSIELLQQSKARQIKAFAIASTPANRASGESSETDLYLGEEVQEAIVALTKEGQEQDQDDTLIEKFFDCTTADDDAAIESLVEEEFFDCVELVQDVDQHFAKKHEKLRHPHGMPKVRVIFPRGSRVNTPFGLGIVEDWQENTAVAAIRFEDESLRYVDKKEITRGAFTTQEISSRIVEERRAELAERVIVKYDLEDTKTGDQITNVALAGAGGAVDSGLRAAGGLALANGVARSGTALGGMVAAPLAVASILVDIGKEFYDYRKKHSERKGLGVLSSTSERLMRRDFRLKTGEVVVSRTTAAAGAGLGAYGVATAMTLWAAAGAATGPIGIVAATSAAVVGGVAGYFGGAKVYSLATASYFKSQKLAKEHIDRLELGARVLFEEHDPSGTGEISKEACLSIMKKLYDISGDTSDFAYEASVEAIKDLEGPVTWRMFWIWVSTEAARSLKSLESLESIPNESERKRDKVVRKLREAKQKHYEKHREGDSPEATEFKEVGKDIIHARAVFAPVLPGDEDSLDEVKATVEALVHSRQLTTGQAFTLYSQLDSSDPVEQLAAREIISALKFTAEPDCELFPLAKPDVEKEGAAVAAPAPIPVSLKSTQMVASQSGALAKLPPLAPCSVGQQGSKPPQVDPRLDVMCSLMSADGLKRFLATQYIVPEDETMTRHEDLHCLALASAVPPASSSLNRANKSLK